ncbi:MAG: GDP-mannose 4,6-dehydratase [Acidimicrobiia bacterium]
MRATVTGAGGFVGPHLVAHLRDRGDDVTEMDLRGPVEIDVTDADSTLSCIEQARPDVVYHLAALSHVGQSWSSPGLSFRVNAEGTLHVLRACLETKVPRVVVILSSEVYGTADPADLPLREDAPLRPVTPYGAGKAAADIVALQTFLADRLDVVRVRPFGHTGPGQTEQFVVPALATRIARAERDGADEIPVGSLTAVRDLSDVRDVVRAYRLLAEHGAPGEVYNVCSGTGVSIQEVADALLEHATRPIRLVTDPDLVRPVDSPRMIGDNSRLRATTGWSPEYPLATTLADVLDAARVRVAAEPRA